MFNYTTFSHFLSSLFSKYINISKFALINLIENDMLIPYKISYMGYFIKFL